MKCQRCQSERLASINGKCNDTCRVEFAGFETEGYIPEDLGVGGGDYLRFEVCLDCGQMQGKYPLPLSFLEKEVSDGEIADFFYNHFDEGDEIKDLGFRHLDSLIKEAKDIHPKFGKFLDDFFNNHSVSAIRSGGKKSYRYPSVEKFVEMFRKNNPWLEEV